MTHQTKVRCSDHAHEARLPINCVTCRQIHMSWTIVTKTVKTLVDAGYSLQTARDEDDMGPEEPTTNVNDMLAELMLVDAEYLRATKGDDYGWVYFVYGNDGWDVINDHSSNLTEVLAPVDALADLLEAQS